MFVLQRVQRDFTIKKKRERETYEKGGREREREKRRPKNNGGTLCVLAVFRVFSIFFSGEGGAKGGGGGCSLIRDAFVNTKLLFFDSSPFFF